MRQTATILACLLICVSSISQQYPFVHYTPKDGLVNSRVRKAYQDSKGRMYFLTFGGLSVYDGARFKNYTTQNGLGANLVNDIIEVGDDSLLVATNNGLYLNVLEKGKMGKLNTTGSTVPVVNQFYRGDNGKIYLCSDNGLFVLEKNEIVPLNIFPFKDIYNGASFAMITGTGNWLLIETSDMNSSRGLYLFDIKNNKFSDAIPGKIMIMGKDFNGQIWVWNSNVLMLVDPEWLSKDKLSLKPLPSEYDEMKEKSIASIGFAKDCIWTIFKNEKSKTAGILRQQRNGYISITEIPNKIAFSGSGNVFPDRENNVWICNEGEGVFKLVNSLLQVYEEPIGNLQGYVDDAFQSNEITWFSTNTNKLFRKYQGVTQEFRCNLKSAPDVFYHGKILLAHDDRNIYEGRPDYKKKFISFQRVIMLPDSDHFLKKLLVDLNGNIITIQERGLCVWKDHKLIFQSTLKHPDLYDDFAFDEKNLLHVTDRYEGLTVFSIHPERENNYLEVLLRFSKDQVKGSPRCIVIDKTGLIWIGTRYDGLMCYRRENENLKLLYHLHSGNGLTDNYVTSLACDSSNNIIVGTQTGLDRIMQGRDNSFRIENLSKNSNLFAQIMQCWADDKQAYARTYAGSIMQVASTTSEISDHSPPLLLEEVKVNAQTSVTGKNRFNWKENNLSFLVAAPSFIDEKQVAYSYLLEGSGNKQWSDTSPSNAVINLTNLSTGNYYLRVKAFFPSGNYNPSELSYSFLVAPPWWRTFWFATVLALVIIGLIVIGLRFYYRTKLEKQKALLEKKQAIEKERTRIATDMHDDLGAGLSRIKFLSETIGLKKQKQQPIEEDITKIREYSHEMIDKMGEIVWALNEKNDSLSDLLSYSRSYAVDYLSQGGIECEVIAPDHFPLIFVSGEFRRNIYLVLKEALHNVIKHAQANKVKIRIDINTSLVIIIQDDGVGFDKDNRRPFSNGLANMEKRMSDIGGKIEIRNEKGTTVIMAAPLA